MKKLLFALMLTLCFSTAAMAADIAITWEWDQTPVPPDMKEWKIYEIGGDALTYTRPYVDPETGPFSYTDTVTFPDGVSTQKCWEATAIDQSDNESGRSNQVCFTFDAEAPPEPANLRLVFP